MFRFPTAAIYKQLLGRTDCCYTMLFIRTKVLLSSSMAGVRHVRGDGRPQRDEGGRSHQVGAWMVTVLVASQGGAFLARKGVKFVSPREGVGGTVVKEWLLDNRFDQAL